MLHFRSDRVIWIVSTRQQLYYFILFVTHTLIYPSYIHHDQTYLFNDQAKSLVQGHDDQALLQSYFDLCGKYVTYVVRTYICSYQTDCNQ